MEGFDSGFLEEVADQDELSWVGLRAIRVPTTTGNKCFELPIAFVSLFTFPNFPQELLVY